jgi:beta-glucuronidase
MKTTVEPSFDYGYLHDHSRVYCHRKDPVLSTMFNLNGRRPVISLDGKWHFAIDPFNSGLRGEWFRDQNEGLSEVGPPDYDFDNWPEISVPSCWNTIDPKYAYYEGAAWYMRTLDLKKPPQDQRFVLGFEGTSGETVVFVNGERAGYHDNGGVPFAVDITDFVVSGTNRILLWIDNSRNPDGVPGDFFDWFNYGGLYRSISLYQIPDSHISSYRLGLNKQMRPECTVEITSATMGAIENPNLQVTVRIGDFMQIDRINSVAVVLALDFDPEFWTPDRPMLYDVQIILQDGEGHELDMVSDSIGFRTIEVRGNSIFLNGEKLFVRGVAVHEDEPVRGRSLTTEDRMKILQDCRDLEANTLRLAHYPHDREMACLADREGILLWEEIPVYWHLQFENPETMSRARRLLESLVRRDINRASVILWSIGNENPDTGGRLEFMKTLAETVRHLDPSRLVTAACLVDVSAYRVTDRLVDFVDVVSINQYYGWYYPGIERVGDVVDSVQDKPVIVSEFGAGAVFSAGDQDEPPKWSEEYQALVFETQLSLLESCRNLAGTIPWLLYDFPSPRRLNSHQMGFNRKGIISHDRTHRKRAFELIKRKYRRHVLPE